MVNDMISDWHFRISRHLAHWIETSDSKLRLREGIILLPTGVVKVVVTCWHDESQPPHTTITFIHDGVVYNRIFHEKEMSTRRIITMAKRFVKEKIISHKSELQQIIENMEDDHKKACAKVGIPYWGSDTPDVLAEMILRYR